ncbi:1-phosphatidylinositol phosphodiesterase [Hyphodiscus hymeniophilus]|uniref:1-phosphatidylinositol phosphodiesterase n=1 Tax=Hyphodiscus hymeniophilus TaxID=353542 RepID=A0A9P7AY60_9HELO|nr:1-phosphatidylinositol phosphodiesterase [Hyphodiscus hymeniophilus]
MALPALTIRNLTLNPIELKLVERFEEPKTVDNGFVSLANITRTFTGIMNRSTGPTSPQLALHAETFTHQDISVLIGALETKKTDIQPNLGEVLRLTFEVDGQRYRVDTPTHSSRSTVLTPLSPNPRFEFTAIHLPSPSYLALYSSSNLNSWMSKLRNETPLSALSIPGTHNSPTHHTALPSVRCQAVSVREQLDNGIRFLDIRVQPEKPSDPTKDGLILVHSAFPVSLTGTKYLRGLMDHIFAFLDANPSETVIVSLKREGIGKSTDQHLSKILHEHYADDPRRWFTENRIPTLGEVRKRVIVIRRFALDDSLKGENNGTGWCIDAESWPDNCADGLCSSGEIRVQDFYEVAEHTNIEKKIGFSTDHLAKAAQAVCPLPGDLKNAEKQAVKFPFFINFLSASNFWRSNCWPDRIAAKVNPAIVHHLCIRHNDSGALWNPEMGDERMAVGDGSTGIVVCDWVGYDGDWDLVRCIVGMNAKLEQREEMLPGP